MNVERCIFLHNKIVQHGWIGSGRSPESLAAQSKTWFEIHGEEAEAVRSDLSPDLVQFLEQAQIPYGTEGESCLDFFYWSGGLSDQEYMFEFEDFLWQYDYAENEHEKCEGDERRRLVLYGAEHFRTGHICGLM